MGFIRRITLKNGETRYYPHVKFDGKKRSLGGYKLKKDAQARLKRAEAELASGTFGRKELTFGAFYERWIASKHNLRESTRVSYEYTFRLHILPSFAGECLEGIKPLNVQEWIDELADSELSPATVGRCFRYFRACMKQAEAWGLIDRAPTVKINLPRKDNGELDFLEPDDILRLLDVSGDTERVLFATLAMSLSLIHI